MIIWLASYPKSGNTLVRALLSSFFYSETGFFDFELVKYIPQFPKKIFFDKIGVDVNNRSLVVKNYIEAQKEINKNKKKKFLKTHGSFCKLENKYEFTDLNNSLGVIYIVRDPRNVVTSLAHHFDVKIDDAYEKLKNNSVYGDTKNVAPSYVGSWGFNYISWREFKKFDKYLVVKYEDLISDTKNTLIKMIKFVEKISNSKIELKKNKILNSIESTDFERLKSLENEKGFNEAYKNKKGETINFFNLGAQNKWQNKLDVKIRLEIERIFKTEMMELNYL
tara:strand:+ start:549 stop:1385 length:837 start_codon:yes stop_codon:yes gene_type:complete